MYKHILVPTDGSKLSRKAVVHGLRLAKALGAEVTGMTSSPTWRDFYPRPRLRMISAADYEREVERDAARSLAVVLRAAKAARVRCATVHARHPDPWRAIIMTARARRCDLIVMASHGHGGMKALLLGSETSKVLAHSKIPVLVHR
jgi:nucleotide-binding universal stress UspA family protein